jgi:hypothetical protein
MSESTPPPAKPEPSTPRYALEVEIKQPPPPKDDSPFEWTPRRLIVLSFLALLFIACTYAAIELDGHPIATVLAVFPQLGVVGGVVISVLGTGSHVDPSAWAKRIAASLSVFAERHTGAGCVFIVLAMAPVAYVGVSMRAISSSMTP